MSSRKFLIRCDCPELKYLEGFEWRVVKGADMNAFSLFTADKAKALAFETNDAAAAFIKKEYSDFMAQGLLIVEVYV
jgi:hypothetical protein